MKLRIEIMGLILATVTSAEAATVAKVTGRVVDEKGAPVAGARIADFWFSERAGMLEPSRAALSGIDGGFSLEVEIHNHDKLVMAVDSTGTLGGLATVFAKAPMEAIQISLMQLVEVRSRYTSESSNRLPGEVYVTVFSGKLPVAAGRFIRNEAVVLTSVQ